MHKSEQPQNPRAVEPSREEQKDQQRDPGLQSYTSGGGDDKAADPKQNLIIEDDPRYKREPRD